jgi:hypothetical protein
LSGPYKVNVTIEKDEDEIKTFLSKEILTTSLEVRVG